MSQLFASASTRNHYVRLIRPMIVVPVPATSVVAIIRRIGFAIALIVAWAWALLAGVGGLILLIHEDAWPITNGWFAMCSGVAASGSRAEAPSTSTSTVDQIGQCTA